MREKGIDPESRRIRVGLRPGTEELYARPFCGQTAPDRQRGRERSESWLLAAASCRRAHGSLGAATPGQRG